MNTWAVNYLNDFHLLGLFQKEKHCHRGRVEDIFFKNTWDFQVFILSLLGNSGKIKAPHLQEILQKYATYCLRRLLPALS